MKNRIELISAFVLFFLVACGGSSPSNRATVGEEDRQVEIAEQKTTVTDSNIYKLYEAGGKIVNLGTESLGRLFAGEVVEGSFDVFNATEKPIVILEVRGSCGCVGLDYDKSPIPAGTVRTIKFMFDSKGKNGKQITEIVVVTNIGRYLVDLESEIK